ncbi:hypothetical protein PFISCL1PPCAC_13523, partial [Pristionchus fissidentatus]
MERPQLYFFLLPVTVISLLLYIRILCLLWRQSDNYSSLFYKLIRTQSLFDMSFVIVYFLYEIPQDWPELYHVLLRLNET